MPLNLTKCMPLAGHLHHVDRIRLRVHTLTVRSYGSFTETDVAFFSLYPCSERFTVYVYMCEHL